MTTIPSAIASLLYDHDTVIVPGLGAFVRHDRSAHVNVITNEFQRPSSSISFDPQQREENALVSDYLMACDGLSDEEARTAIATFVSECFASLKDEGSVSLPELGMLTMNEQHSLMLEPLADLNFNGDAFGLEDLNPQPVYGGKTENGEPSKENRTGEPVRPPKTKPIPVEEPKRGVIEPEEEPRRRTWWIWLLLLLLVAAGVALWYFKSRPVPTQPWPVPSLQLPERQHFAITEKPALFTKPEPLQIIVPDATSKVFIVGGCFDMEKNALNMGEEARRQGCAEVFVMKRGSKYFVCYGQYPNIAEAKAAMPYALANYNPKAWILTK